MTDVFPSLLLVIATATHNELASQIEYLKVDNQILWRKLPGRITITPQERHPLVKFAKKFGIDVERAPSIASS